MENTFIDFVTIPEILTNIGGMFTAITFGSVFLLSPFLIKTFLKNVDQKCKVKTNGQTRTSSQDTLPTSGYLPEADQFQSLR